MEIGLALSGGGIKGAAHIGVIQALEEKNIKIKYISGASSGSIVAILYAMGYTPKEILKIFKKYANEINYVEIKNIFKLIFNILIRGEIIIKGFSSGKKIEELINKLAVKKKIKNINEINFPILIPTVNINTGEIVNFLNKEFRYSSKQQFISNVSPGIAVRASCSFPAVFEPCDFKNMQLSDGAIRENIPWQGLKDMGAQKIICSVFKENKKEKKCKNFIDIIFNSLGILQDELEIHELDGVENKIEIKTDNIGLLEKSKINFLYNLGYITAKEKIKEIA